MENMEEKKKRKSINDSITNFCERTSQNEEKESQKNCKKKKDDDVSPSRDTISTISNVNNNERGKEVPMNPKNKKIPKNLVDNDDFDAEGEWIDDLLHSDGNDGSKSKNDSKNDKDNKNKKKPYIYFINLLES